MSVSSQLANVPPALQQAMIALQGEESALSEVIAARQALDQQLSENELVMREFKLLKPHNTVYKLMGPSLVPQDATEAKGNVEKRLEYIRSEINRVEGQLKDGQEKLGKKRDELMRLQQEYQKQNPSAVRQSA